MMNIISIELGEFQNRWIDTNIERFRIIFIISNYIYYYVYTPSAPLGINYTESGTISLRNSENYFLDANIGRFRFF